MLINITGATFKNNHSGSGGGALSLCGDLYITGNTLFDGNYSGRGGAINIGWSSAYISGTNEFKNNYTTSGSGGVIRTENGTGCIIKLSGNGSKATFTGNIAKNDGGAMSIAGDKDSISISDETTNTFTLNKAGGNGGAIFSEKNDSTITIEGKSTNTFTSNSAGNNGGAIYSAGTLTISGGTNTFGGIDKDGNSLGNSASSYGGAIYTRGKLEFSGSTNSSFSNNSSSIGGAIAVHNGQNLVISGNDSVLTFENNTATGWDGGGAIYVNGNLTINGNKTTFKGNVAKSSHGGAIHPMTLNIQGSGTNIFESNIASSFGGAVRLWGASTITGTTTNTFDGNTAGKDGGAIYTPSTLEFSGGSVTEFKNNTATSGNGGAIYCAGATFTGNDTVVTFSNNYANGVKNDIYSTGDITISGSGTYTFDGGITITGGHTLKISGDATVTFPEDAKIDITGGITFESATMNIDLNDNKSTTLYSASEAFTLKDSEVNIDASKTSNTMNVGSVVAESASTMGIKYNSNIVANRGDVQTIIATATPTETKTNVTGFVDYVVWAVTNEGSLELWTKAKSEGVVVLSPLVRNEYFNGEDKLTDKDISIYDAYYYNPKDSANQSMTLLANMTNEKTITLNVSGDSDDTISTLRLASDSNTVKVVSNSNLENELIKSTADTTILTAENITFEGKAVTTTGLLSLSGKNVTFNHKTEALDSKPIIVANEFYIEPTTDVTFGSMIDADTLLETTAKLYIGTDSSDGDTLTITKGFTSEDQSVINIDVLQFGDTSASASGNDALEVTNGELNIKSGTILNLAIANTYLAGDNFWVKFTGTTVPQTTVENVQTILDTLDISDLFSKLEYTNEGGTYFIHGVMKANAPGVPEPSTWALLILGSIGLYFVRRRNAKK